MWSQVSQDTSVVGRCDLPIFFRSSSYSSVLQLLDQCIEYFDEELHNFLQLNGHSAHDYAYFCIEGFSAYRQPARQVVKLWDLFLSHGLHLNVLAVVTRMLRKRDDIMGGEE
jgi:hypothetical protein